MLWRCVLVKILKSEFVTSLFGLTLLIFAGQYADAENNTSYEQRLAFVKAKNALRTGRSSEFLSIRETLHDYVLEPYLIYYENQGRVANLKPEQIMELREKLADTTLGDRLFDQWLVAQATRKRWQVYAKHYEGNPDNLAACNYLSALFHLGRMDAMLEVAPSLWVVGKSQPKACDPPFARWIRDGHVTHDIAWRRLKLALDSKSWQLSKYLFRFFKPAAQKSARLLYDVHRRPSRAKNHSLFANDRWGRAAWTHGLERLARSDAHQAQSTWLAHKGKFDFDENVVVAFESELVFWISRAGSVPATVHEEYALRTRTSIVDTLISQEQFSAADAWMQTFPQTELDKYKWRFWRGYIDHHRKVDGAGSVLHELAKERTYYGFLAADMLEIPASMNHSTLSMQDKAIALNDIRIQRVLELFAVNELHNARLEWKKLLVDLDEKKKGALVYEFDKIGMHYDAIMAANQMDLLDLVDVRFPMPYLHLFQRYSHETGVDIAFLLAISRQESAFNPDAVSPVGARGLMQLMRPTARITASQINVRAPTSQSLLDPTVSVRIGSHHVAHLMDEFSNNRVLVAVSYNAGASRAKQWLLEMPDMNVLSWIERIPFSETRNYVKNVISISHVYSHRLNAPNPVLYSYERQIGSTGRRD